MARKRRGSGRRGKKPRTIKPESVKKDKEKPAQKEPVIVHIDPPKETEKSHHEHKHETHEHAHKHAHHAHHTHHHKKPKKGFKLKTPAFAIVSVAMAKKAFAKAFEPKTYKRKKHTHHVHHDKATTKKRGKFRRFIVWLLKKWKIWLVLFLIFAGLFWWFILRELPTPTNLTKYDQTPIATKIYDREGELLYEIFAEQNRTLVTIDQIPVHLQHATIAIEDKDFYNHFGINLTGGMLRALIDTATGGSLQGGSTITQQLIKNTLLTPERTIERKVKEVILAVWADLIYSKDEILTMYLNTVPYGGTAWGVDTAARKYFAKDVSELTLAESALLAGLPQSPTRYSPFGARPELAKQRQEAVLNRMVQDGYISQEEADDAKDQELEYAPQEENIKAPHFSLYVKDQLVEQFGEKLVEQGGLKVTTTLDYDLQEKAEEAVKEEIEDLENYDVSNGAAIITRPPTGEIVAMVGSVDYFKEGWGNVNVPLRLRQPGSSIKPINYAIGIENREITAASVFSDQPKCYPNPSGKAYCPKNYDGTYHGPVQTRFALANSYNIPAVKMLELNTVETMVASASAFGLDSLDDPERYGLSLTLGGGEVTMLDMAEAFSVFANGGKRKDLSAILKVEDKDGTVLYEFDDPNYVKTLDEPLPYPSSLLLVGEQVVSAETAFLISHMLLDNGARTPAFGSSSELRITDREAVSVKTGTTDDIRDNWTVGYTPNFLVATWVGNNDNSPMNPYLVSGVTGAAPIWNSIMTSALENQEDVWPRQPAGIVGRSVCNISGLIPAAEGGCPSGTRFEYFIAGTEPKAYYELRQPLTIDKESGAVARPGQTENIETQEHPVLLDVVGDAFCLDCPQRTSDNN